MLPNMQSESARALLTIKQRVLQFECERECLHDLTKYNVYNKCFS